MWPKGYLHKTAGSGVGWMRFRPVVGQDVFRGLSGLGHQPKPPIKKVTKLVSSARALGAGATESIGAFSL